MMKIDASKLLPLTEAPLVHCITNEVTCETVANALLYIGAKPIMACDPREFDELFRQTDGLLLNIGHLSEERERSLVAAVKLANKVGKPTVVDLVGYGVSRTRDRIGRQLVEEKPTVVKGIFLNCVIFAAYQAMPAEWMAVSWIKAIQQSKS